MDYSHVEAIYRDEYPRLIRMATRRVGRNLAEDVVQDAFVDLLSGKAEDEDARDYLIRRAASLADTTGQRERRQRAILLQEYGGRPQDGRRTPEGEGSFGEDALHPHGTEAGELVGYPYNALGEQTWS